MSNNIIIVIINFSWVYHIVVANQGLESSPYNWGRAE